MAAEFHSLSHPNAEATEAPCAMVYTWATFITVQYRLDIKKNTIRNKYKTKLFKDNPETIFADCYK
jgi:hypothetical protein